MNRAKIGASDVDLLPYAPTSLFDLREALVQRRARYEAARAECQSAPGYIALSARIYELNCLIASLENQ